MNITHYLLTEWYMIHIMKKIAWFLLRITCMEIMKSHEDKYFLRRKYNFGMKCKTCEQII